MGGGGGGVRSKSWKNLDFFHFFPNYFSLVFIFLFLLVWLNFYEGSEVSYFFTKYKLYIKITRIQNFSLLAQMTNEVSFAKTKGQKVLGYVGKAEFGGI